MDLTSVAELKTLLGKHGIKPRKHLGQNFLINKTVLKKLIDAAEISKNDTLLEVGAGLGTITVELAKYAKRVIAVEKDKNLIPILKETTKDFSNIEILQGDILKLLTTAETPISTGSDPDRLLNFLGSDPVESSCYKMVGNIPYYLTAPLIRKFLEAGNPPKSMTLMVQKEMAQRICAQPPDMSILAVSVQFYAKPKIVAYVSRSSFWPMPEVDSAIIKITTPTISPLVRGRVRGGHNQIFFTIVKAGFSSPRKQLVNNLSKGLEINIEETKKWMVGVDIDPKRRAETLTIEEWIKLAQSML